VLAKQDWEGERGDTTEARCGWKPALVAGQERGSTTWHSQGRLFQVLFALRDRQAGALVVAGEWAAEQKFQRDTWHAESRDHNRLAVHRKKRREIMRWL